MSIWAISDPHLSFGVPNKSMDFFGPEWTGYEKKMEENWRAVIKPNDLVLIPGDISWAMKMEEALPDLNWIHELPGTKLILKGNHDFWWSSASKLTKALPPSIHFIQNNHFDWNDVTIGGARLWDTDEYHFYSQIEFQENPREKEHQEIDNEKIFNRDLERLRLSLKQLNPQARVRIALTHYPPIGLDLAPSRASAILEEFKIDICVFGHLHSLKKTGNQLFGEARGVKYYLTSCDYLNFAPLRIL